MLNVNVIYHHFPHYRRPILRELVVNGKHNYRFYGALNDFSGIKAYKGDEIVRIKDLDFKLRGGVWVLKRYWPCVFDKTSEIIIVIGNPNMPASWLIAIVGRLIGKKVLFWSHGWLRLEPLPKRILRNIYFRMAKAVLVYSERAKKLAEISGFPAEKVFPIYNSIDFEEAQKEIYNIESSKHKNDFFPQSLFENKSLPVLICTARLTKECQFDILFEAVSKLGGVNILLVGAGDEMGNLKLLAMNLKINVHFYGACYNEEILSRLIYHSDLTVSPGKVGLTVIHSLTYGTPAISHGSLDDQMPEVETIIPGVTGLLFEKNNPDDLADKIKNWLAQDKSREEIRYACRSVVEKNWNPKRQREEIDSVIDRFV